MLLEENDTRGNDEGFDDASESDERVALFAGLGTPVAYLVDDGRVSSALAHGAVEVPELMRGLVAETDS